jgi:hypothetical protein
MPAAIGVVIARCDLMLNNTSWVPTSTACTISLAPAQPVDAIAATAASRIAENGAHDR